MSPRARTSNDFNTPQEVVDCTLLLGEIGLDPCSNPWSIVPAEVKLSLENGDDGLSVSWEGYGLVYVNPPYGRGHMDVWAQKIASEDAEIVALVKCDPTTKWWQILRGAADAICYPSYRLRFGGGKSGAEFASAIFYFGPQAENFAIHFAVLGDTRILAEGDRIPYNPVTPQSTKGKDVMNIKQNIPPGECAAKRCKQEATHTVPSEAWDIEGRRIPLCDRHTKAADKKYHLSEIVDGVIPLAAVPAVEAVVVPEREIAQETEAAKAALAEVQTLQINTQDDLEFVADALKQVKGRYNRIKEKQEEITKPMNAALKAARELFKPPLTLYEKIEQALKAKIAEHAQKQAERNMEAMKAAAAGDESALQNMTNLAEIDGISTRTNWRFEVEDESLIPRAFWMLNEKAILALARETKGTGSIPGIKFVPEVTVASRSA